MFTGNPQVFPAISMEEGCKNHRETLYSSNGKVVYVVRKPCNVYRLQGKPYDNYKFSPKFVNTTVNTTTYTIFLFEEYRVYRVPIGFPCNIYEKGCKNHRETLYSSKRNIVYVVGNPQ